MIFRSDNPERDFEMYDAYQADKLKKRPVCEVCGEHIADDHYYDLFDVKVCPDCLKEYCDENLKVNIETD